MFGALSGVFAHAAAAIVCFWGVLLVYFAFRVLGLPLVGRLAEATTLHRLFVRHRVAALHGVELRAGDAPIDHLLRTNAGLLVLDVRDYGAGEIIGDPTSETWTHRHGLHRAVVPNPLPVNVRHVQRTGETCGLRPDGLKGLVVIGKGTLLPPEIEAQVVRLESLDALLRQTRQADYARPAELNRAWNTLCDIAQLGAPTTLHNLLHMAHPQHLLRLEALQWLAIGAGLAGAIAFLWGMSIMRR